MKKVIRQIRAWTNLNFHTGRQRLLLVLCFILFSLLYSEARLLIIYKLQYCNSYSSAIFLHLLIFVKIKNCIARIRQAFFSAV